VTAVVRAYQPGDESSIVALSNRCLAPYAGWIPRTVEYWRWSTLARPGVEPTDILLLEKGGAIVGYTAMLGRDGSVLEFCVDPDQPSRGRRALIKQLIGALEEHARAHQCDDLTFWEPAADILMDKVLRESGYVVAQSQYFSAGILNPQYLLQQILAARGEQLTGLRITAFVFELSPGNYPFLLNSRLLVRLEPDVEVIDISDVAEYPRECVVRTDLCALTELLFCGATVDSILQRSQLDIQPQASVADARKLLETLAIRGSWHVPRSDAF
jgi:hypothetical protein